MEIRPAAKFIPYHTQKPKQVKRFVAWDGEGITPPDNAQQNYVLFGNSEGACIISEDGSNLGTDACLELLLDADPDAIHVAFSFGYDVEMILADVPHQKMWFLHKFGRLSWNGYYIEHRRSKWFYVKRDGRSVRVWDIWGYFQSSFVKALVANLPDHPTTMRITSGKESRNTFRIEELYSHVLPYWSEETAAIAELAEKLRDNLYSVGLCINRWHGPGSVASFEYNRRGITKHKAECPEAVTVAAQYGYAGGRFELFRAGRLNAPVYTYDIRSAYPWAIAQLPSLTEWEHVTDPSQIERFGIYRITFSTRMLFSSVPMPLFYRDSMSLIHFPAYVTGWYWSPEARIAKSLGATIHEGWVLNDNGERPFSWVNDVYEERAQMKRDGNGAQMALKLSLNSLYGKMAQRVGGTIEKPPRWHQLEWAGFVTSATRAKLFHAMMQAAKQNALISVETDGIFSSVPLTLDEGPGLGQWEADAYDDIIYLQSGFYFAQKGDSWVARYRGFDKNSVSREQALAALTEVGQPSLGNITGASTRFATMGGWLHSKDRDANRRVWKTEPRTLSVGNDGKRVHRPMLCHACGNGATAAESMHTLTNRMPVGGESFPHDLPWVTTPKRPINIIRLHPDTSIAADERI